MAGWPEGSSVFALQSGMSKLAIDNSCTIIGLLKALIAIPKVQPRFALAIWKKYPTMRSLLNVYMDPNKSVHEKEFLLKDLKIEGLLGDDRRLGEPDFDDSLIVLKVHLKLIFDIGEQHLGYEYSAKDFISVGIWMMSRV
ncbi:hypothetical protein RHGRI_029833 [Rhododendron griersonianum]|uniref:Uncharacterized protein n=1 Tax=Rhododendron griersonianum TaxID=479676 RepID=A0AAV6IKU6_9ERIC|nr:hypothetical protein RHGRI_029833 [Rhododendron griersonianum]